MPSASADCTMKTLWLRGEVGQMLPTTPLPRVAGTEGFCLMPFLLTSVTAGLEHPYCPPVNLSVSTLVLPARVSDSGRDM